MATKSQHCLSFKVVAQCGTSMARTSILTLPHAAVETPVFMPVGTQGTIKGLLPKQLEQLNCRLILGNTYHLGMRPDSGGFQMVSLVKLSEVTEDGVRFESPYDSREILLTPEKSVEIQNAIGADIMMQLDDVVSSTVSGPRVEEAMHRTYRWLDRCLVSHKKPSSQNIFPIVQGGLDPELRKLCVAELLKRDVAGYAIGGLSGGEAKDDFWKMVHLSASLLPNNKPRYLMGVGFSVDLVVCCALGCDMFDCVFPTRTARFGSALVRTGQLNLKNKKYEQDFRPIDEICECSTCKRYSRAYLHSVATRLPVACHLLSIHNIAYQMRLMNDIRVSIKNDTFPEFVKDFMVKMYPEHKYPAWAAKALETVNIVLP